SSTCRCDLSLLFSSVHTHRLSSLSFFFNDPPTTEIYTLSLHDALPISMLCASARSANFGEARFTKRALPRSDAVAPVNRMLPPRDRKSTRLNSSHQIISYAVFCLKKKKKTQDTTNAVYTENTHTGTYHS